MRGRRDPQVTMLGFIDLESRVPPEHPLRTIKALADQALAALSPEFDRMYAEAGRPSIPPERLLKASVLIALYSVRSERAFCEELDYHLLFRWFLDMNLIEPSFDPTTFTKNRKRLLEHHVGQALFDEVVMAADRHGLLSDEHFTVDGTLIEAAASLKSFRPRDGDPPSTTDGDSGNPSVDFRGERRSNTTHQSTTDPEARLLRKGKGKEAKLVFMAHALMENRHGMLTDFQVSSATGTAERDAVPVLLEQARERGFHPRTLGGDKNYDTRECVAAMRERRVTPHVAQNTSGRRSAIDGRTARHRGYAVSQRIRKRVEEIFGWMKTVGGFRRTRYRGLDRTGLAGYTDLGAYSIGRSGGSIVQSTDWASGVYRIGDDVHVTVTFSENVTVTDSPQLELTIGSSNRTAEYESTDGSVVVFRYTVAEGDTDSDGIAIGANKLTLRSGSIKDGADNDANLSHNALADQDGHKVDGIRPRIARFFLASSTGGSDGAYSQGEEMIIVAEFTEDNPRGSVNGPPQVKLDFDGEEKMARWDISLLFDSPRDYGIFGYVVQEGDLDSDGVAIRANSIDLNGGFIRDPAGNDAILTHSAVAASSLFKVDAVAPTVSSIAITSDPGDDDTYGIGDKIEVTVTFSENMSFPISITCSRNVVHCKAELELDIGGTARTADYQSHDGADVVYAYTVQAGDTDDNGISIGANNLTGQRIMDAAGRNGEGINDADLSHDAVADDESHKVSGNSSSLTLSGDTTINYAENSEGSVATYTLSGSDGTITWSLSGDDSDDFSLSGENATTRALSFASSPNYEDPTDGDINNQYDVTIQASDGTNSSTLQVTVIVTNVRHDADELPVITGTARVGETLTVDTSPIPDTDQNTRFGYLWIRTDGGTDTNIDGAANSSYTLTDDDEGKSLKVLVGFCTTGGERVRLTSEATAAVAAPPASNSLAKGVPTITGTAQVGGTLTADTSGITDEDGLNDVTFTHQWVREDSVVVGSAARSYTPTDGDRGKAIKVRVSFTDDAGNPETRTSAQTAAVEARSDTTPESLALVYDNNYPTGIWSNGTTIWVANFSTSEESRLYAYDLATWTHLPDRDITSLYDAGNRQPWGLWSDGAIFWVTDLSRSKIYAYDLTTGDYLPDRDIETLWTAGNERPLAIWSDGITLWVCDSDDEKIYAYDLATGERRSDRDINTMKDAGNHAAVGMWSDGVTMWVSDRGDDKIYAYELATGVRQPDLDFDELYSVTGSGSAIGSYDPLGLWSDSATMWVTDVYQFKVFAYDMPETAALKSLRLDGADSEFAPWRFNHTSRVTSTTTRTTVAATAV